MRPNVSTHEWRRRALIAFFAATAAGALLATASRDALEIVVNVANLAVIIVAGWTLLFAYLLWRGVVPPGRWTGWSAASQLLQGAGAILWFGPNLVVPMHLRVGHGADIEMVQRVGQALLFAGYLAAVSARQRLRSETP